MPAPTEWDSPLAFYSSTSVGKKCIGGLYPSCDSLFANRPIPIRVDEMGGRKEKMGMTGIIF